MRISDALNDYKRYRGDATRFPGERRTTTGRFSGRDGRLVHVERDGSIRDFSYPLVGLTGVARSRFGVRPIDGDGVTWFDSERATQQYHATTALVVTGHETVHGHITQYDLTLGDVHVTHFERETDEPIEIVASVGFAPDGRNARVGQLHHGDAVEVYHAEEVSYLASTPGFETIRGVPFGGFEDLLEGTPDTYPRDAPGSSSGEDLLSGDLVGIVPLGGGATVATFLTTRADRSRETALETVRAAARDQDPASLQRAAQRQVDPAIGTDLPHADAIASDLRVLSLLSGRTGLRVAGPDFDPYYAHSGGYGYSWFRDDAEISRFLLEVDRRFDLGLDDRHARSAGIYRETQLDDGTWPHRVWPFDATLAPGWANDRLETGNSVEYQADQTGSVAAFLAVADGNDSLERTLDGLDASLAADGRPVTCQNVWENMTGRFTHTASTVLEAYSALAATNVDGITTRATNRAETVYTALDDLWIEERGIYALREYGEGHERAGELDHRCDSATFALASAHRAYDRIGDLEECRLDRLVSHVETVIEALTREATAVSGLVRYEEDSWRQREQGHEKIWTVATAWGAYAGAVLTELLADRGDKRTDELAATARELLALVLPGGPLCLDNGYLPEQVFDDGTPDSATPIGWSHALRLATIALLDEHAWDERHPVAAED